MEDILKKWNAELDLQTGEFHKIGQQVSRWDRVILENGTKISKIYKALQGTQNMQREIDQSLEYIEAQQNELDSTLDAYHSQIKDLLEGPEGQSRFRYLYFAFIFVVHVFLKQKSE